MIDAPISRNEYYFLGLIAQLEHPFADIRSLRLSTHTFCSHDFLQQKELREAVIAGNVPKVRTLLAEGCYTDWTGEEDGKTALHVACQNGQANMWDVLIAEGASLDATDKDGQTPLYMACQGHHEDLCDLLIAKGASVDVTDDEGRTQLYLACLNDHGDVDVRDMLVAKGASVDLIDKYGRTQLCLACMARHFNVCDMLIAKGGNVNAADNDGRTALSTGQAIKAGWMFSIGSFEMALI